MIVRIVLCVTFQTRLLWCNIQYALLETSRFVLLTRVVKTDMLLTCEIQMFIIYESFALYIKFTPTRESRNDRVIESIGNFGSLATCVRSKRNNLTYRPLKVVNENRVPQLPI